MAEAKRDQNVVTTLLAVTNDSNLTPTLLRVDATSPNRLLVDAAGTITATPPKDSTATYNVVSVTTSATVILAANSSRNLWAVTHEDTLPVYIGFSSSVTSGDSGTGFPIVANQIYGDDIYTGGIWAIVASGTANLKYWEY